METAEVGGFSRFLGGRGGIQSSFAVSIYEEGRHIMSSRVGILGREE